MDDDGNFFCFSSLRKTSIFGRSLFYPLMEWKSKRSRRSTITRFISLISQRAVKSSATLCEIEVIGIIGATLAPAPFLLCSRNYVLWVSLLSFSLSRVKKKTNTDLSRCRSRLRSLTGQCRSLSSPRETSSSNFT